MSTTRIRTAAVALVAALSLGAAATSAEAAIKSTTNTGDQRHDDFCRQAAALISHAQAQRDAQDDSSTEWSEWNDLASELILRAEGSGCSFAPARRVPVQATGPRPSTVAPTITAPASTTARTRPSTGAIAEPTAGSTKPPEPTAVAQRPKPGSGTSEECKRLQVEYEGELSAAYRLWGKGYQASALRAAEAARSVRLDAERAGCSWTRQYA